MDTKKYLDIPDNIKNYVYYDEILGELIIKEETPKKIKEEWELWKNKINDFEELKNKKSE